MCCTGRACTGLFEKRLQSALNGHPREHVLTRTQGCEEDSGKMRAASHEDKERWTYLLAGHFSSLCLPFVLTEDAILLLVMYTLPTLAFFGVSSMPLPSALLPHSAANLLLCGEGTSCQYRLYILLLL